MGLFRYQRSRYLGFFSDLNPVWDQIIYVPGKKPHIYYYMTTHPVAVHSLKETLFLECMDYQHLTKDRSLGYVELRLNELAVEADSEEYPYKSTGKKADAAHLKFEKGVFKGQLHYEAEFVPALALKDFKFSTSGHHIRNANGDATNGEGEDIEDEAIPAGITTRGPLGAKRKENHVKNAGSTDTTRTSIDELDDNSSIESSTESVDKTKPGKGVVRSKEELMQHRTPQLSSSLLRISQWL